ncbi:hypothetical protein XENTR_v10020317 [Xenopus tropicalis]|nr:hypothetical protein XENTR_v10020317 [Xenopus tropicalis]
MCFFPLPKRLFWVQGPPYLIIMNPLLLTIRILAVTEGFCAHIKAQGCRLSYTGNSEYHSCIIKDIVPPTVNDKDISSH